MVAFIVLVVLIILLGFALNVLIRSILELCHVLNDIEIEKRKKQRREYLYGTGYTEKDIDESIQY